MGFPQGVGLSAGAIANVSGDPPGGYGGVIDGFGEAARGPGGIDIGLNAHRMLLPFRASHRAHKPERGGPAPRACVVEYVFMRTHLLPR